MLGKRFYVFIDFLAYKLVSINTAVEAPNMNSIIPRNSSTDRILRPHKTVSQDSWQDRTTPG